jgi:hypothetical protein
MFKFHFNDLGHHVNSKLLNKPINNVESNFCSLDPLGVVTMKEPKVLLNALKNCTYVTLKNHHQLYLMNIFVHLLESCLFIHKVEIP